MPLVTPEYLIRVFLVFVRVGGLMVTAPFLGHGSVNIRVRILFSVILAYILVGFAPGPLPDEATDPVYLALLVAREALTGLAMGYSAQFIFWAVQFAGEIIGFQMGLSMAQIYNPLEGEYANPIGRLLSYMFLMLFLIIDGHHQILQALVLSFEFVPLTGAQVAASGPLLLSWTGKLFITSLRLASPFMVTIFMVDLALGIFARVVPQADLFSLGLPLKLMVGLGLTYLFLQNLVPVIPGLVDGMYQDMMALLEAFVS